MSLNNNKSSSSASASSASAFASVSSPLECAQQIIDLSRDARYLAAKELWNNNNIDEFLEYIEDKAKKQTLETIRTRFNEVSDAMHQQALSEDSDWIHAISYYGIDTHYKLEGEGQDFAIRMEGKLEGVPLFEQAAVVHEVDLWTDWMPFVKHSKTVDKVSHGDIVAYAAVSLPLISRDVLLHMYCADCLQESGKVVILGKSIKTWPTFDEATMAKSYGWLSHDRVEIHDVKVVVDVLSPTEIKTTILMSFDLKLSYIPQSLINFITRNLAGVFLSLFQARAKSVFEDPKCSTSKLICTKTDFYFEFLYIKLKRLCDSKNWPLHLSTSMTSAIDIFLAKSNIGCEKTITTTRNAGAEETLFIDSSNAAATSNIGETVLSRLEGDK